MRIPLGWLREYTELPQGAGPEDLMRDLVAVGIEEEQVHTLAFHGPIVVGAVEALIDETQKNGKIIHWCQVRVIPQGQNQQIAGEGIAPDGVQNIVCGAHNFGLGDKVLVALPGATIGEGPPIVPRMVYGHHSAGMMVSIAELGLGSESGGIIRLSDWQLDPPVGTPLTDLLLGETVAAEVETTPDRGYQLSVRGLAREYAAATHSPFRDPASVPKVVQADGLGYPANIDDAEQGIATRFLLRVVHELDPEAKTPLWMAARLSLAGIRPVSLPVDIAQYVMWELGQPIHLYDGEKLSGALTVRRAHPGEAFTTLAGRDCLLDAEDLVVADEQGPVALAGILGGSRAGVSAQTREVLIEAARFDEAVLGRSRRRHRLSSEASKRFERGVDSHITAIAAQRVADLLEELGGGKPDPHGTELGTVPPLHSVLLPCKYACERVGAEFSAEQIEQSLHDIGAKVKRRQDHYEVEIPPWRFDLNIADDLVEEVVRLVGYDVIPARLPVAPPGRGLTRDQRVKRRLLQSLADAGMTQVLSYPFVSRASNTMFALSRAGQTLRTNAPFMVPILNPISRENGFLNVSLLPGLLATAKRNVSRGFRDLALYEAGPVFLADHPLGASDIPVSDRRPDRETLARLDRALPHQPYFMAAVLIGQEHSPALGLEQRPWDYADACDVIRLSAAIVGAHLTLEQGKHPAFHPGRTAVFYDENRQLVGVAGELHPSLLKTWDLPQRTVAAELNVEALLLRTRAVTEASSLSSYPLAHQDVALIVPEDLPAGQVMELFRAECGELLEDLILFDDYRGPGIGVGKKSLAFGLRFRASDRTLTVQEISAVREEAVAAAHKKWGAVLRGPGEL